MKSKFVALVISTLIASATIGAAQTNLKGPDKVKSKKEILGRVIGFEVGDFTHVLIKDGQGHKSSYFIGAKPELLYFLAAHPRIRLKMEVQVVDTYVEQAGQRMEVEQVSNAWYKKDSVRHWWTRQIRRNSSEALTKKYDDLVSRLTQHAR